MLFRKVSEPSTAHLHAANVPNPTATFYNQQMIIACGNIGGLGPISEAKKNAIVPEATTTL